MDLNKAKGGEGTTANEGAVVGAHVESKVGLVKNRSAGDVLDGDPSTVCSGSSSIDPGGKRYNSKPGSTDQD